MTNRIDSCFTYLFYNFNHSFFDSHFLFACTSISIHWLLFSFLISNNYLNNIEYIIYIYMFSVFILNYSKLFRFSFFMYEWGFPGGSVGKESACYAEDPGLIPGLGRSPGGGNCNPLQYSCLENPMERRAWQATVHGVARVRHD